MQLQAILAQREERWNARRAFASLYGSAVLTLTLNIPGADKNIEGAEAAFILLQQRLRRDVTAVCASETPFLAERQWQGADGPCWMASIALQPLQLKALCVDVEEKHPLGRLADVDVMDAQGQPVSRADLGFAPRSCFLCDAPASLCRRQGLHKKAELMAYVRKLLRHAVELFGLEMPLNGLHTPAPQAVPWEQLGHISSERVGKLATHAALLEAGASPKPGLVCPHDNGAHKDMDYGTFVRSAVALQPYFTAAHALGRATAPTTPEAVFPQLRTMGIHAEKSMFAVTGGVNTHKGLIFSLGLFCAAVGRLCSARATIHSVCATAASFCQGIVRADLGALPCLTQAAHGLPDVVPARARHALPRVLRPVLEKALHRALTPGEVIYILYGCGGVRDEAEQGFPHVLLAWNALQRHGGSATLHTALVHTLLELVACVEDSSVLWRGGSRGLALARAYARRTLALRGLDSAAGGSMLQRMCAAFVRRRLSPGGCADTLAIATFLHLLHAPRP